MKNSLIAITFLLFMNSALGQKSFKECDELWKSMSEMTQCQKKANLAKENEMDLLIKKIQSTFKSKEQALAVKETQEHWANYIESECRSRMIPSALSGVSNAAIYHYCRHKKLSSRLLELKDNHYCDLNGCPERIDG